MPNIRFSLWGDHEVFLYGLDKVISSIEGYTLSSIIRGNVYPERSSGCEILILAFVESPMVVLERLKDLKRIKRDESVMVFINERIDARETFFFLNAGANAILPYSVSVAEIKSALDALKFGQNHFSPSICKENILKEVMKYLMTGKMPQSLKDRSTLTQRETQILRILVEGGNVKDVAQKLNISVKTVEAHKFNLMRKLDIHNKADLMRYAYSSGILILEEPKKVVSIAG